MPSSGSGTGTPITATPITNDAGVAPSLSLEIFRREIGYQPWHFWGLAGAAVPVNSRCNGLVRQYAWQGQDAVGRTEIAQAIGEAERKLAAYLGYRIAPQYAQATVPWPAPADRRMVRWAAIDARGEYLSVQLPEGYVQAVGTETHTLISTANATYSDADGDGLDDTFAVTAATSITDPARIAVYIAEADRFDGSERSERWRVQPVTITISGGTVTVMGPAWLVVKPVKYESTAAIDPAVAANFVSTLELVDRATDTTDVGTLLYDARPTWEGLWCGAEAESSSTDLTSAVIRDGVRGIVAPAISSSACIRPPARVTLNYLAGYPASGGTVDRRWWTIVARLAIAELARPICACEGANAQIYEWSFDLARAAGKLQEQFQIGADALDNPFGTRRGHVYAWKQLGQLRRTRGILVG